MRLVDFIEQNPEVKGVFVNTNGRWFNEPKKGFEYQTREEILNVTPVEEPKEKETNTNKNNKKK